MSNPQQIKRDDVQNRRGSRQTQIDRVGVKDILHPAVVKDRNGGEQQTVARFSLCVSLPRHFKGTHMSRFMEILNLHEHATVRSFHEMLFEIKDKLEAETSHVEMSFPYFIEKSAPISRVRSLMDYNVTFIGRLERDDLQVKIRVAVPATSLCPCSRGISDYGAHSQRSLITATVHIRGFIWIEELVELVEQEASCDLYGILKRPDEKYVTERAYDNPKFVEDIVRDVAGRLNADDRIAAYTVESENLESIHNHSAYAVIEKDKTPNTEY
ncbi:MAG: GTP cyclohydrolase I FolE2 [Gammaproteobacteria bacterium]|nr:GTP cyclohydrolase I FolE2 [Gammaproteobacteria bacterium]